jgi:MFS family permease
MIWRGWAGWALAAAFFGYGWALRVSPSVMVGDLMRDFAVGAAALGHLSAMYLYPYALLQLPVGVLMDKVGPRRLMAAATALVAVGCVVFALAGAVSGAYVGRALIGIGSAFTWVGVLSVIAQWFPASRFAMLGGFGQFIGMSCAALGQGPLAALVEASGWRATLWLFAALGGMLAMLIALMTRDRPHPATSATRLTDGLRVVLSNRQSWLYAFAAMAMITPCMAFAGLWAVPYLGAAYGIERQTAGVIASLMFLGLGCGAPLTGWVSDRLGRRKPLVMAGLVVTVLTMLAVLYLPRLPVAAIAGLIFLCGIANATFVLCFAGSRDHNPAWASGVAIALVNCLVITTGALFQPLLGTILDALWDGSMAGGARIYTPETYRTALALLPAFGLIGLVTTPLLRDARPEREERK